MRCIIPHNLELEMLHPLRRRLAQPTVHYRLLPFRSNARVRTPACFRHQSTSSPPSSAASRVDRIVSKLPIFIRPYATTVLSRPGSHLTSFLILHELTAVIPLFAFFYIFNSTGWNPADLLPQQWIEQGYARFKRYIEKKGWGERISGRGVMDLATSYAVVKALVPVRVAVSLWGAPWFARVFILPVVGLFRRG
ncbi:hypothetical protein AA313_de0203589 [Arthrobotrys entomopaga]|nr:hypothetical protein AA313_de0203589 [Arthrobotrys entomopaga]